MEIVKTNQEYTYEKMKNDITFLKRKYPKILVGSIGKSTLRREYILFKIRIREKKINDKCSTSCKRMAD